MMMMSNTLGSHISEFITTTTTTATTTNNYAYEILGVELSLSDILNLLIWELKVNLLQDAQSTGGCGIAVGEARYFKDKSNSPNEEISKNSMLQEVGQFNATGMHMDLPDESPEMDRAEDKNTQSKSASGSFREADKDTCNVESGSRLNPMKGRNCTDQMSDNGEFPNLLEHAKESGFRGMIEETDKVEASPNEERQPRKRKRNIMNLRQIALIEKALLDEPEMQRNASLLQSWADKLSVHVCRKHTSYLA